MQLESAKCMARVMFQSIENDSKQTNKIESTNNMASMNSRMNQRLIAFTPIVKIEHFQISGMLLKLFSFILWSKIFLQYWN